MTETRDVISASLARCERIVAGLDELRPLLHDVLPVRANDLEWLDLIPRTAAIALLKRYEQLQDLTGRLVRAVLDWRGEDVRAMTRRDLANWMERLHLLDDADRWVDFSNLRNRLVHEYPIDEAEQVERVNACWAAAPELVEVVAAVKRHLAEAGFYR